MINRELIRIKVVQLVYANLTNGGKSMEDIVKELDESLSVASDLYFHMLSLICDITDYAAQRYEMNCTQLLERGIRTLPSDRFVVNRFANQLQINKYLEIFQDSNKKLRWINHEDVVHSLYNTITQSPEYEDYLNSEDDSYEADRQIWRTLYKKYIYQNELVDEALEDLSLYWNDDRFVIDTFVMKTIKRFKEENGSDQPLLNSQEHQQERTFGRELLVQTIGHRLEYEELLKGHTRGWDFSRLLTMDVVVILTALGEIINMPEISVSVSINEYLNIAKMYCTPKNTSFINAALDNIVRDLRKQGKLFK